MFELARMSNKDIVYALEHDSEFLINFFLAEEATCPVPEFHAQIMDKMCHLKVKQLSLAVPRAHSKTTLAQIAAIHHLLFTNMSYVLYMSSTSGHSVACVNDIVSWIESENFVKVFGECEFHSRQEGKGFYDFTLPTGKRCILKAFGAGQKVRGTKINRRRPQLVIVDDLEDNDNIANPDLFMALKRWVYGPFKKCVDQFNNKWIWIGNMIKQQSMLYENHQSEYWYSVLYGCILSDGTPLWPDLWPIDALRKDFAEYQEAGLADVWFAEMMNMPMAGINAVIKSEEIPYLPKVVPREQELGFMTVDLAISEQDWAHKTAVAIHVWQPELSMWQVAFTNAWRGMDPVALFYELVSLGETWGIYLIGIESVAYQKSLQPVFDHFCLLENITGFTFVGVPARARKAARIITWAGTLRAGKYALTEGDYEVTQELLSYDPLKKDNEDDTIDCCAHGSTMLSMYQYEIWTQKEQEKREPAKAIGAYEIART